jgi:hypothetical protein
MLKNGVARQATHDNTAHKHFMLDNWGYRHRTRIRNISSFSTQQPLRGRASVTLYVGLHCISCSTENI